MLLKDLVFDKALYPRNSVSGAHIAQIYNALLAGVSFPPIIVDEKSLRIIDGVHRWSVYKRHYGEDWECDGVIDLQPYADEEALWLGAVEANAEHGLGYTSYDRTRLLLEAERRGIKRDVISSVLRMPIKGAEKLVMSRTALEKVPARPMKGRRPGRPAQMRPHALKGSMKPLAGQVLTARQVEASKSAGGLHVSYYIQQLLNLLECGVLDWCTETARVKFGILRDELNARLDGLPVKPPRKIARKKPAARHGAAPIPRRPRKAAAG